MKYYQARDDMKLQGVQTFSDFLTPDGREVLQWEFGYGRPVEWSGGPLSVKILEQGRPLDARFNTWNALIVSEKARRVFEEWAPNAVQYFPLNMLADAQPYFIANIVQLVDCLDEKLSHVERFVENDPVRPDRAGEISLVIDLHIDVERAANHHLFRVKGYNVATIVSEKLKYALEKAGVTGLKFDHVTSPTVADFRVKFAERQRQRKAM